MQHRRPRLMAKILAFVLAVSLVFPVSAFASVAIWQMTPVLQANLWQTPTPTCR